MTTTTTTTPVRRALDVIAQLIAAERDRGGLDDHDRAVLERSLGTLRDQRPELELIVCARLAAGRDAVLYVHDSGDVILWPDAASAEGDDGTRARNRWHLDPGDAEALRPLATE